MKPNRIDQEAARWVVRLQGGPLSAAEQTEFDVWLTAGARHQGAFARAQAVATHLDRVAALGSPQAKVGNESGPVPARGDRRWFLAAGVGGVVVSALAGRWLLRAGGEEYGTEVGEIRRITLADGSTMLLNTASRATVHFTQALREVRLRQGEALFEVFKDAGRPFVVRAGALSVRAVGTAFAVRAVDQHPDVTVTEGVVEVADTSAPASAVPQRVVANERVLETGAGLDVKPIAPAEVTRRLAWRDGLLSFAGQPLADAVSEINRHNHRQIHIDDPALAARPVVGLFRTSDAPGFARTVAAALGVESIETDDGIHLRSAATP